jgi:hypothetical protein
MQPFRRFEPYPVRFDAIAGLIVHAETKRTVLLRADEPMDIISVKNCATVADMSKAEPYRFQTRF